MTDRNRTRPALAGAVLLATLVVAPEPAAADLRQRVALGGGDDLQLSPSALEGHGWGLVSGGWPWSSS